MGGQGRENKKKLSARTLFPCKRKPVVNRRRLLCIRDVPGNVRAQDVSFLPSSHPSRLINIPRLRFPYGGVHVGKKGDSRGGGGRGKERLTLTDAAESHFPFPSFSAHLSQAIALLHLLPIRAKVQKMSYPHSTRTGAPFYEDEKYVSKSLYKPYYSPHFARHAPPL